jgi:hypothetical protein
MFEDFPPVLFPVSGVRVSIFVPPLVAFAISAVTSTAGVSGAFLILPFQVSWLRHTAPSVSATNFVCNLVAIPGGVYCYIREGRMAWPLTWVVAAGTLPAVFFGYWLRVRYLLDPRNFKAFVGCEPLYLGLRLLADVAGARGEVPAPCGRGGTRAGGTAGGRFAPGGRGADEVRLA